MKEAEEEIGRRSIGECLVKLDERERERERERQRERDREMGRSIDR